MLTLLARLSPRPQSFVILSLTGLVACGGGGGDGGSAAGASVSSSAGSSSSSSGSSSSGSSSSSSSSSSSGGPGAHNTGVPAGTVLTPSGSLVLNTPGQVVDRLDVTGCVSVRAPNVTIRRSRIRCDSYYPVEVQAGASLLIEDSEIDGSPAGGIATSGIASSNYVARRVNIHGAADGVKADDNVLVEDSWIHDLWLGAGDHADGVQGTGGSNVTIRNNRIDIRDTGKGHGGEPNSAIQLGTEWSSNSNWRIEGNWFYGGGWILHLDAGSGSGNVVSGNRFGDGTAGYGPIATQGSWQQSGNIWIPSLKSAD